MRRVWATLLLFIGVIRYMGRLATLPKRREHMLSVKDMQGIVRMMFISDVHNNRILSRIAEEDVDFIVLGGDFVDKRVSDKTMRYNLELLKKMKKPIYFIPGNNDGEKQSTPELMEQFGVRVLSNETIEEEGYSITGIDPYSGDEVIKPEKSSIRPSFLIMHDPFLMKQMSAFAEDYDLILSGHTHGGQIRFMDYGPYERGGWKTFEGKRVFVSEGYGTSLLPLRLETQSEYHVFVLQCEK
ncbi:metallophosphoesterase [Salimicrobium flavidum]|uniref:metallophosphoesterase n=1 Tax=Salimicrobium flavidum TaxID=570947 RepID=UPI000970DB44|nr:metallophosphoesterase [Salimicrobium flavidum]